MSSIMFKVVVTVDAADQLENTFQMSFASPRELVHWLKLRSRTPKTKRGALAVRSVVRLEEIVQAQPRSCVSIKLL